MLPGGGFNQGGGAPTPSRPSFPHERRRAAAAAAQQPQNADDAPATTTTTTTTTTTSEAPAAPAPAATTSGGAGSMLAALAASSPEKSPPIPANAAAAPPPPAHPARPPLGDATNDPAAQSRGQELVAAQKARAPPPPEPEPEPEPPIASTYDPSFVDNQSAGYAFDPVTGMLRDPGAPSENAMTRTRVVESGGVGGGFRRVQEDSGGGASDRRALGRAFAMRAAAEDASQGSLRAVAVATQSTVTCLGFFAQGILAGVAATNVFMTYFLDAANLPGGSSNSGFLKYYSPIAVIAQRMFVTLSVISLLASVDKYAKDSLGGFLLQGFAVRRFDALAILCFFLCFLFSVINVPFEDRLYYAYVRVPSWWEYETLAGDFNSDVNTFHGLNFSRCFFALLGFLCVCATTTPAVLDVIERAEELTKVHAGERSFGAKAVYENDEGEMEPPRGFGNTNAGGGGGGGSRTPDRRRSPGGSPTRGSPGGFQWRDNAVAERDGVGRSRYGQGRRGY